MRESQTSSVDQVRPAAETVLMCSGQLSNLRSFRAMTRKLRASLLTGDSRCEQVAGADAATTGLRWFTIVTDRGLA